MAVTDAIWNFARHFLGPANKFVAITTGDTTAADIPLTRGVFVGVGGDVVAVDADGNEVLHKNMQAGITYPMRVRRINSTNTTATNMVAWY